MKSLDISLLYVEDEKILRTIYSKILREKVDTLYVAEDGQQGLELYKEFKPDIILADIKMPVMDGITMIKEIKKIHPEAKTIIMSAYGQTQYFMQAISIGVKGFLVKPVDNNQLWTLLGELASATLLEKEIKREEERRKKAEQELKRSEGILRSVSFAAEMFLDKSFSDDTINEVLDALGKATDVSRVYIFENGTESGALLTTQKYEWVGEGVKSEMDNPDLKDFDLKRFGFGRWVDYLSDGIPLFGLVKDFPQSEKEILEPQEIKSICIVPIYVVKNWWGFIGFDDCNHSREWTNAEIKALTAAADIIGSAVYRNQVERELIELNDELENRVEDRTKDLQKEIKERMSAEIMLRESEEKYREIFENANDGILLSIDGIIRLVNPKLYELTGFLPKECISKSFTEFIHIDYQDIVKENHFKRLNGEEVPERYDILAYHKSGDLKWFEIKSTLISWEAKPAILTFLTDITERKKTAEELQVLNYKLEQRVKEELKKIEHQQQLLIQKSKLESLGELAAGIAHEINQPLVGISMSLDNMLIKTNDDGITAEYLNKKIQQSFEDIERIRKIINHIRIFSRDQDKEEFHVFNVNEVVRDAIGMVKHQYKNHQINIDIASAEQEFLSFGNKFKLEQVILNLMSNAKYAVEEKKKTQDNSYEMTIQVEIKQENGHISIIVKDNGIGIPPDKINKIFDPFFTTKKLEIGTGLGLSISYGIIKEMNGDIKVDSKPNEYTRIQIRIPSHK